MRKSVASQQMVEIMVVMYRIFDKRIEKRIEKRGDVGYNIHNYPKRKGK